MIDYANSGDKSGDYSSVVGYLSAVFIDDHDENSFVEQKDESEQNKNNSGKDCDLTREEKLFLLGYARKVIENRLSGKETMIEIPPSTVLREKRGGFVTLKIKNRLRGCIGSVSYTHLTLPTTPYV